MQGTKPRTVSSIGMFDLLKGVGMLTIVLVHTAELYSFEAVSGASLTTFFPFIYRESLMAAFYIASGYGFRKRSIGKCIGQQCKSLLKPYLFTALATTALHFVIHYRSFGYLPGTLGESIKVLGGFALGLPHTAAYGGYTFFSCGPMWYLLALLVGWVLLDIILNIFPEGYQPWAVLSVMLLGWGTCLAWELPFCLSQGMVILPYLYIGFIAKKQRLFERAFSAREGLLLATAFAAVAAGALVTRSTDCVSLGTWTMGPVSILLDGVVGYGLIALFLRWNRGQGALVSALEAVGRRSLYIFCVHTVELIAIPWYLLAERFTAHPAAGIALQYAISLVSILLVCELLLRRREWRMRLLPARKHPAAKRSVSKH